MANPKTRRKMINEFAHFLDLEPRFARRIPSHLQTIDRIEALLKEKGAPEMRHVMGAGRLDGQDVPLRATLEAVVDEAWGTFLSCIPGVLGYFGGEGPNERYILQKEPELR